MKHIHSSSILHPSEDSPSPQKKRVQKRVCEIIVCLPGGRVLGGFRKSIETPETKTIFDVCKMLMKQPPAAA